MLRTFQAVVVVVVVAGSLAGCPPPVVPLDIPDGCQPLLHEIACGLPYPSDHFLVDDAALPSGHRVTITGAAKLFTTEGRSADINDFLPQDGFSRHAPIVWTFGVPVDPASLPRLADDAAATTADGFKVALVRASDGARVAVFVDVDPRATDSAREALIMRPLQKLDAETRYVVAISGVTDIDGAPVPVPEAFRRLREGSVAVGEDPVLAPVLAHYEDAVFPVVETAGLARDTLQLAWDFTTGSDRQVTHDMLRARTLVLAELERTAPTVEVEAFFEGEQLVRVFDDRPENAWRFVELRVTGPRIVDGDAAGALLARDADGEVALNGTTTFDVTVVIPATVRDGFAPGSALMYGHGFFGRRDEVEFGSTRHIANESGRVLFGLDWLGMSIEDVGVVSGSIGNEVSEALRFGERVPQAMMNWLTLTELVSSGGLDDVTAIVSGNVEVKPFRRPVDGPGTSVKGAVSNANGAIVGRDDVTFLGVSQGHILGGVQSALNAKIRRTVLMSGGAGFSHMMFRARPFEGFLFFLNLSLPDPLEQQLLAAQMQGEFDRFDAAAWAPYISAEPLPEGPDGGHVGRRILLQTGRGDSQVPNLGTFLHARYLGLPWVATSEVVAPSDFDVVTTPFDGSGIAVFDMGIDPAFEASANIPAEENFVHNELRSTVEAVTQMTAFFADGVIVNPCGSAPCGVLARP